MKIRISVLFEFWNKTDMCYEIDFPAVIIERKYNVNLFTPNTLFLFGDRSSSRIKGLLWEGNGFLLLYKHEQIYGSKVIHADESPIKCMRIDKSKTIKRLTCGSTTNLPKRGMS